MRRISDGWIWWFFDFFWNLILWEIKMWIVTPLIFENWFNCSVGQLLLHCWTYCYRHNRSRYRIIYLGVGDLLSPVAWYNSLWIRLQIASFIFLVHFPFHQSPKYFLLYAYWGFLRVRVWNYCLHESTGDAGEKLELPLPIVKWLQEKNSFSPLGGLWFLRRTQ